MERYIVKTIQNHLIVLNKLNKLNLNISTETEITYKFKLRFILKFVSENKT